MRCATTFTDKQIAAFWARVHKTDTCWIWTGRRVKRTGMPHEQQYGAFGRRFKAHRVSWLINRGPIPRGQWVLHKCDNRPCVNPAHLFIGDRQANMDDMVAKGRAATGERSGQRTKPWRAARGSRNGRTKLTEAQVIEIRRLNASGVSQLDLSRRFRVDTGTMCRIINRGTWKHV